MPLQSLTRFGCNRYKFNIFETMDNNTKKVSALFNSWAGTQRGENMATGHDELVNYVFNQWELQPHHSLLDVGCGNGRALSMARQLGVDHLAGIDIAPKMIEQAKLNVKDADLQVGAIEELPWKTQSFTHVLSIEALYYLSDPLAGCKAIKNVLKPGGKAGIAIEYYLENKGAHVWAKNLPEVKLLSENEWKALLESAGFTNVTSQRIVRKNKKSSDTFVASPSFPDYDLYLEYINAGALFLSGAA